MICSSCQVDNEPGRRFCKECGTALQLACPACSTRNGADAKFCGECGASLARPAALASAAAPRTARRVVSVVFADLVGFTTLAEHRDAEDVRELLSRYFDVARAAVDRHGGMVEKFIGDAVMAVWGSKTAHEDDAERSVRAAFEVLDGVASLGRELSVELTARAGVVSGETAVTVGATSQGLVAGDVVNTASRLQSAAQPGTVVVDDSTRRAAGKAIAFAELGALVLKGKAEPTRAWRAVRVTGQRKGLGGTGVPEPPFVARDEALHLVKELLHATGRERKARLVSVTGIGGIGKSRLAWELRKYVDGLEETVYWHQGRCPAYGDGVTFWALGEMVRMRAGIAETDSPAESRAKLAAAVRAHLADEEEQAWAEPRLAHLLGLEAGPPGDREELFASWRALFERLAESSTTALVFEDLQWADPGLLDFIDSMLEWSRQLPILIVTLARPELLDKRPTWGAGQRSFTALHLEPLPDPAMSELVRGFVHGLPEPGVDQVVARADGVPLYAVETVRMLADRGVVERREDGFELVGELGGLDTPETLQALIAARLDALAPEERERLQDAAVMGKSFTVDALAAVSGTERAGLEVTLRELVRKDFLGQEGDPRSPERGQYTFRQALIREVAYATLSRSDRRRKHLTAAHHLESRADEELAGVVATHYVEAFRATADGPDADALAARARDWLSQAADRALSLGSPAQALGFVEQALGITPEGRERTDLLERAGEAADLCGQSAAAVAFLDEGIARSRERGEVALVARLTARLARPLAMLDRRPEARARLESALGELPPEADEGARARLCFELAELVGQAGDRRTALALVEQVLEVAERLDLPRLVAEAMSVKSLTLLSLGRHLEAVVLARGALGLAAASGSRLARAKALLDLGCLLTEEDPQEALPLFLEAADTARRAGRRWTQRVAQANAAETAVDVGRWEVADTVLAELEAEQLPRMIAVGAALDAALLHAFRGDFVAAARSLDGLAVRESADTMVAERTWTERVRATVSLLSGDWDAAYTQAMGAAAADPSGMNAPTAVWVAARAALWLGDPERTGRALGAMEALRGRWIGAARLSTRAGLAALEGRLEEAAAGYAEALQAWSAMDLPLDLAFTTIDALSVLPTEQLPEGAADRARALLDGLGARPLLERLAAVQAAPQGAGAAAVPVPRTPDPGPVREPVS